MIPMRCIPAVKLGSSCIRDVFDARGGRGRSYDKK
jgi:hypothetical protein